MVPPLGRRCLLTDTFTELYDVSVCSLAVLVRYLMPDFLRSYCPEVDQALRHRRLPPHGQSPFRSCLRLVLVIDWLHLVCCPPVNSHFRTGDLHPTSLRPCRAYHAHGAAIHAELEVNDNRRRTVTLVVILLNQRS